MEETMVIQVQLEKTCRLYNDLRYKQITMSLILFLLGVVWSRV